MKKILTVLLICIFSITTKAFAFTDVPESHWACEKIKFMAGRGIIKGFPDETFKPDAVATREQAAAILRNFFGFVLKENPKVFSDVQEDRWSKEAIDLAGQYLYDEGSDKFRPEETTQRIEVANALIRFLGFQDNKANLELINQFTDKDEFANEDKNVIALMVENGIMQGYGKTFKPRTRLTRAELCTLLYNAFNERSALLTKNDDKIVMSVNGKDVSVKEFNLYFNLKQKLYEQALETSDIWYKKYDDTIFYSECKEDTKNELSSTIISLQKAKEQNITLDENVKKQLEDASKSERGQEICNYYGITEEDMFKINEDSQIINLLAQKVYSQLDHSQHSHDDIEKLHDETSYDVRHILILTQGMSEDEKAKAKKLAEEVLIRAIDGEDFATLAQEYSDDGGSKNNGGLYENVKLGQFVKEMETVAINNEIGKVYPKLVETTYGYHIVKPEEVKIQKVPLDETTKAEIIQTDFNEETDKWLEDAEILVNEDVYKRI